MLKGIPHILSPDPLHALQSMGHGDEITIADGNYPGASTAQRLIRADGHSVSDLLEAILSLLPLDHFVPDPAIVMQVVGDPAATPPAVAEFAAIVAKHDPGTALTSLERFAFYERVRTGYAVVQTGDRRFYANIILKKGVIAPD